MGYGFSHRIKRVFLSFKNINPDTKHIFGQKAELYVKNMLLQLNKPLFTNKILKHPKLKSRYIESDIILIWSNFVFCIEIKRVKGKIFASKNGIIQENYKPFTRRYQGYRAKTIKNPQKQSQLFAKTLKSHLVNKDKRFLSVKFVSVSVFSYEADISEIHSFEEGILYFDELIEFIKAKTKDSHQEYEWIVKAVESLKGFDVLINKNNLPIMGLIENNTFECTGKQGFFKADFSEIKQIIIKRNSVFSIGDELEIHFKNGKKVSVLCYEGCIKFNAFNGIRKHFLRNLNKICINSR